MNSHTDCTPATIQLVIFDWAGTTVDHGSLAPVHAFGAAFRAHGVELTQQEIRGPMGLGKKDHIRNLFGLDTAASQWKQQHGRDWTEDDVETLYQAFTPLQVEEAKTLSQLIPGVADCFETLKSRGIAVGSSTGYPRVVADPTVELAAGQGYMPDATVCADEVPAGRPAPWMIFRNMEQLGVFPPSAVLKVGDTVPDIQAGHNAGVRTIGITRTGSEVGLSLEDWEQLEPDSKHAALEQAEQVLRQAGADDVLESISELPDWLDQHTA
jgi:phosphonoacetaldehyde hydrolase